jgi:hypothetical protein
MSPRRELICQPGLADARLARNQEHPPIAGNGVIERAAELRKFALASDEPFARHRTLAFSRPEEAYRRSADFFLSQMVIPLKCLLSVSKWRASGKSS